MNKTRELALDIRIIIDAEDLIDEVGYEKAHNIVKNQIEQECIKDIESVLNGLHEVSGYYPIAIREVYTKSFK